GANVGSGATASLTDTVVNAPHGQVTVQADSQGHIDASVGNFSDTDATGRPRTRGLALGAVLSMNKVSDRANASVSYASLPAHRQGVQAGTGIHVLAADGAHIDSAVTLTTDVTLAITAGRPGNPFSNPQSSAIGVAGAVSLNDVRGGAGATVTDARLVTATGPIEVKADETAAITSNNTSQLQASDTINGRRRLFGE